MFKEIRRQITLFNTLILIAFLLLFILLLVFLVQWSFKRSGEKALINAAQRIRNENLSHYATDPSYTSKVNSLIRNNNLTQSDKVYT